METIYTQTENEKIKSAHIKAINEAEKKRKEVKKELSTPEGKQSMLDRIFGKDSK